MKDKKEIESLKARQAELARELENVGDRIGKLETEKAFVPGWYMPKKVYLSDDILMLVHFQTNDKKENVESLYGELELATLERISKFCSVAPKTRYNWPEIIKKYPEAQWASTDEDGRKDYWNGKPEKRICSWGGAYRCGTDASGSDAPNWTDSLEKRPDNL